MQTDQRAIVAIADSLARFFEEMKNEEPHPEKLSFPHEEWQMIITNGATFIFKRNETREALIGFQIRFRRTGWTKKWSEDYIGQSENRVLDAAYHDSTHENILAALREESVILDADAPEQIVILPIAQLYLGELVLDLPNISVKTITQPRLNDIREHCYSIIDRTPHSSEDKDSLKIRYAERTDIYLGRVCAFVTTFGDVELVKENARIQSETILDFFQMIATLYESPSKKIRIRLGGDLVTRQPGITVMSTDKKQLHDEVKFLFDFRLELNQSRIDEMKTRGFGPLMEILGKTDLNELEKLVLQSMHWIADAGRQELLENQTTSYITAVEMFFSEKNEPITRDVSEGVAMILGSTLENRKYIVKRIKNFYDQRSSVSHTGARLNENEHDDIQELANIAINVLVKIASYSSEWITRNGLRAWMYDQRLTPKI